jgi:O-antigen ligase
MTTPRKSSEAENADSGPAERGNWPALGETASFCLLVATLAWAPFPLGSNRPWSWTLMTLLIVAAWLCWLGSVWERPAGAARSLRRVAVPLVLASLALLWGVAQCVSWMPRSWLHPVWQVAAEGLGQPLRAMVSLNGWNSITELMKLVTYMMAGWLAYVLCQRPERARRLLDALIVIGTCYAAYALVMAMLGIVQVQVFYTTSAGGSSPVAAPFVTHASFASFVGMITLCACVRLFALGAENIVSIRGPRQLFLTALKFVFGRGTPPLVAALLLFSLLVAAASRAGFLATLVGIMVLLAFASAIGSGRTTKWTFAGVVVAALSAFLLFQLNGGTLEERLSSTSGDTILEVRGVLWSAATHMVTDAPLPGLGLGSFSNAYPLYADQVYPFNMDKAHNDYLELAAGWGLGAAVAWWAALLWLGMVCARGIVQRRRNRIYPLIAVAATVLIAVHSIFDFTLQIPAVALTYATILGMGVAQSFSTRA